LGRRPIWDRTAKPLPITAGEYLTGLRQNEGSRIMNYEMFFEQQLRGLRREGRYRVFADIERQAGRFPRALHHGPSGPREVTVWCSNDYPVKRFSHG
jgi:hypothetical protein